MSRRSAYRAVLAAAAVLLPATLACDQLQSLLNGTPAGLLIPPDAVRVRVINDLDFPVQADLVFTLAGGEVRRSSRYLAPQGVDDQIVTLPTQADSLAFEAREAVTPTARAGDLIAEKVFVRGTDFEAGDEVIIRLRELIAPVAETNQSPAADAGADQSVPSQSLVVLSGEGSFDPDGDPLTFAWEQIDGAAVELDSSDAANATFQAPHVAPGQSIDLSFRLTVADDEGLTDSDEVAVTVVGPQPLVVEADASVATVAAGGQVTLSAAASGGAPPYSFAWSVEPPPDLDEGVLSDPNAAATAWTAPLGSEGDWHFTVNVTDSQSNAASASTQVGVLIDCNTNGQSDRSEIIDGFGDCDENGTLDECDIAAGAPDCDTNGRIDFCETIRRVGNNIDCNINGVPDVCDIAGDTSEDCNSNGYPDECDLAARAHDCNQNGTPDECEIAAGTLMDCNTNDVADGCEEFSDCNENNTPDECDIAAGAPDCNTNGVIDHCESFQRTGDFGDCNFNGVPDACDIAGDTSEDCNTNGYPDECDLAARRSDCNENGTPDECDIATGVLADCNTNQFPDLCEKGHDCDWNGTLDECDIAFNGAADCNTNQFPDTCEEYYDCNTNAKPDECDIGAGTSYDCNTNHRADECDAYFGGQDCNENGTPDACDIAAGAASDCNTNQLPDCCEDYEDCNKNGKPDECDLAAGTAQDCNTNGRPDFCDAFIGHSDCNENGTPDECDVAVGYSRDCNENGRPDECEFCDDCNHNSVPDECDIAGGTSQDCNSNGQPDECDLIDRSSYDCNQNGRPDECDIAGGTSADCNENEFPDECEDAGDCNTNGTPDFCEPDCNTNGSVDICDVRSGHSADCNTNLIPDECDAESGLAQDCNTNGRLDECESLLSGTTVGPTPYLGIADSPIRTFGNFLFVYETFEDGLLNVPGVGASTNARVIGPGSDTDSVDEDDGEIDGHGNKGRSLFASNGSTGITFSFNPGVLDGYPRRAGVVWTDGSGIVTFEAFNAAGALIAQKSGKSDDSDNGGRTAEDRFYGVISNSGIATIKIRNQSGGIEVDHLQYGMQPGDSVDCNTNLRPDECDIADGDSQDVDCDMVPDECDISIGSCVDP